MTERKQTVLLNLVLVVTFTLVSGSQSPTKDDPSHTDSKEKRFVLTKECGADEYCVDLDGTGTLTGSLPGVSILSPMTGLQNGIPCSRQVVLRVEFHQLSNYSGVCWPDSYGQQQLLKIQMYLSDKGRAGWMFNIGDSISNNGFAGDAGHSDFSAEVDGHAGSYVQVWANTRQPEVTCKAQLLASDQYALRPGVQWFNVYVANHFLKVTNDEHLNNATCNECLFGLNGQSDLRGGANADQYIYVAANRVVGGAYRYGDGLCRLKMRWVTSPDQ